MHVPQIAIHSQTELYQFLEWDGKQNPHFGGASVYHCPYLPREKDGQIRREIGAEGNNSRQLKEAPKQKKKKKNRQKEKKLETKEFNEKRSNPIWG